MKFNLEQLLSKQTNVKGEDDFPEEGKRFTDDKRTEARMLAIQAVFMYFASEDRTAAGIINESLEYFGLKAAQLDKKLFAKVVEKAIADKEAIIEEIQNNLDETWSFNRLEDTTSSILITSVAELMLKENPKEIIISEYMALANAFVEKDQASFINGVLASVIKNYNL